MPATQRAPTELIKHKAHRSACSVIKKPVGGSAPSPVTEFDAAANREKIAEVADSSTRINHLWSKGAPGSVAPALLRRANSSREGFCITENPAMVGLIPLYAGETLDFRYRGSLAWIQVKARLVH
jgi:hypothetical protein